MASDAHANIEEPSDSYPKLGRGIDHLLEGLLSKLA
jgi:hypothetical protein